MVSKPDIEPTREPLLHLAGKLCRIRRGHGQFPKSFLHAVLPSKISAMTFYPQHSVTLFEVLLFGEYGMHLHVTNRPARSTGRTGLPESGFTTSDAKNLELAREKLNSAIEDWFKKDESIFQLANLSNVRAALAGAVSGSFLLLDEACLYPEIVERMPWQLWCAFGRFAEASGCPITSICFPQGMLEFPAGCLMAGTLEYIELFKFEGTSINLIDIEQSENTLHLAMKGTRNAVTITAKENLWLLPTGHEEKLTVHFLGRSGLTSIRLVAPAANELLHGVHATNSSALVLPPYDDATIDQCRRNLDSATDVWLGRHQLLQFCVRGIKNDLQNSASAWVLSLDDTRLNPEQLAGMPATVWGALHELSHSRGWGIGHVCFPSGMQGLPEGLAQLPALDCIELPEYGGTVIDLLPFAMSDKLVHLALAGTKQDVSVKVDRHVELVHSGADGKVFIDYINNKTTVLETPSHLKAVSNAVFDGVVTAATPDQVSFKETKITEELMREVARRYLSAREKFVLLGFEFPQASAQLSPAFARVHLDIVERFISSVADSDCGLGVKIDYLKKIAGCKNPISDLLFAAFDYGETGVLAALLDLMSKPEVNEKLILAGFENPEFSTTKEKNLSLLTAIFASGISRE